MRLLLLSLLSFALATVKNCDPNSLLQITTLSLTPDPPIQGEPVKLSLVFNNPGEAITAGTATTTVSLNGLPFSSTGSLCEDTECPIVSGVNDRSVVSDWPDVSDVITSKIMWSNDNGESLLCIQIKVSPSNALVKRFRGELQNISEY